MKSNVLFLLLFFISSSSLACTIGNYSSCIEQASAGDHKAQTGLGFMYAKGRGLDKDPVEALKWYRLAAEQGNAFAQSEIGVMYMDGVGVDQDYKEAIKWYQLAAEQGYAGAQRLLARMYKLGRGVEQNDELALLWMKKADAQGNMRLELVLSFFSMLISFLVLYQLNKLFNSRVYAMIIVFILGSIFAYYYQSVVFFTSVLLAIVMTELSIYTHSKAEKATS
jgi:hypothetical protein